MAWSHEKLRFSCIDNIGLKQLWKLIALDTANAAAPTSQNNSNNNNSHNVEQPKANNNINNEVSLLAEKKALQGSQTKWRPVTVTSMQSHIRVVESKRSRESDNPLFTQFSEGILFILYTIGAKLRFSMKNLVEFWDILTNLPDYAAN